MGEDPARIRERERLLGLLSVGPKARRRRHKYRAQAKEYNGVRYDSKAEAARARALDQLLAVGEILDWIRQPTVRLGVPENVYRPDFLVIPTAGEVAWYEDVKGMETSKFKRDKVLWRRYGRLELRIFRGGRRVETVLPDEKETP